MSWTAVLIAVAALVWATALDKVRAVGPWPADRVQRANLLALVALALALTITVPPVYATIGRLTGIANLGLLLANVVTVAGVWVFQPLVRQARELAGDYARQHGVTGLLIESTRARRAFADGRVAVGVAIALVALFALAPVRAAETPDYSDFMARYATARFVPAYTALFAAYVGGMVSELFLLAASVSVKLPSPALRLRGYLQAAGWAAYIAALAHELLYTLVRHLGHAYPVAEARLVRHALIAGGVLLLMSGGLIDLCAWGRRWLDHRRLYPLWRELWCALPEVMEDPAFRPARSALPDALAVDDLASRRYRRVITIRDAIVALRPYSDEAAVARARALCRAANTGGAETAAIAEAVAIRSAIGARARGGIARRAEARAGDDPARPSPIDVNQLAEREVAHLVRVARASRRSRIVAAALAGAPAPARAPGGAGEGVS